MGGTKRRPYGSTAKTRQRVLAALGVVKVATAGQIRRLMCPGTAGAQTVRNGCLDLGVTAWWSRSVRPAAPTRTATWSPRGCGT